MASWKVTVQSRLPAPEAARVVCTDPTRGCLTLQHMVPQSQQSRLSNGFVRRRPLDMCRSRGARRLAVAVLLVDDAATPRCAAFPEAVLQAFTTENPHGSLIARVLSTGELPGPSEFRGLGGKPLVFRFKESTLCPKVTDADHNLFVLAIPGLHEEQVLYIITQEPALEYMFAVLFAIRAAGEKHGQEAMREQMRLAATTLVHQKLRAGAEPPAFGRDVPRQLPAAVSGDCFLDEARWTAHWAIRGLLEDAPQLLGDGLLQLLSCALQEWSLILVAKDGSANANKLAMLLNALCSPFRWQHTFLPTLIPSGARNFSYSELAEATPVIAVADETFAPQGNTVLAVVDQNLHLTFPQDQHTQDQQGSRWMQCWSAFGAAGQASPLLPGHNKLDKSLRKLTGDVVAARQIQELMEQAMHSIAENCWTWFQASAQLDQFVDADTAFDSTYRPCSEAELQRFVAPCRRADRAFYKSLYMTTAFHSMILSKLGSFEDYKAMSDKSTEDETLSDPGDDSSR